MFSAALLPILLASQLAQTEVHKCVDEDGNIAFQQTPCPPPVESEPLLPTPAPGEEPPAATPAVEVPPAAEPVPDGMPEPPPVATPVRAETRAPEDVEACKMPFRDQIDAIEAEMLRGYSAEQGEEFKQELRGLTQQMRACE